ncbi:YihY/virulence factor BrkB family protein [Kitasatospora sp. NPDC089797]|uniref:YihY/virulence factor BrkB family protein n=1 Tax=Kitasatospora sp. NPDC089797 TaxID=3155298 RepID=UPI0034398491
MGLLRRLDDYQRGHPRVGLVPAIVYKFVDDQGAYLAALITYYGFLSVFPALLLLVTVLGFALHGDPRLQQQILHSALGQFPVIGDQIAGNIRSLQGNGTALGIGVAGSLYGASGVAQAVQNAFDTVWGIPRHRRRTAVAARARGIPLLGLMVGAAGASGVLTTVGATVDVGSAPLNSLLRAAAGPLAIVVNGAALLLAFKLLIGYDLRVRLLWPEALGAAFVWQLLLSAGTYYVGHVLKGATATYGLFGIVLGLMAWLYLAALVLVACAESAAVRHLRLWPRGLATPFVADPDLTVADRRAYTSYATAAAFTAGEDVSVEFRAPTGSAPTGDGPAAPGRHRAPGPPAVDSTVRRVGRRRTR